MVSLKHAFVAERAEHFVGGDVMEAEGVALRAATPPVVERGLQQRRGADDVGGDESPGPSIERSTWLSAARCMTTSGRKSSNAERNGGAVADVGLGGNV